MHEFKEKNILSVFKYTCQLCGVITNNFVVHPHLSSRYTQFVLFYHGYAVSWIQRGTIFSSSQHVFF